MGSSKKVETSAAGWVRTSAARMWRWEAGPVVIRLQHGRGWMVELSRHGLNGRISIPIDGPFDTFHEARREAERRLPASRGAGLKGDALQRLRALRDGGNAAPASHGTPAAA